MRKVHLTMVLFILAIPTLALAAEDVVKIQGCVMEVDLKCNILIVNEKSFSLHQGTVIKTEKGASFDIGKLKPKMWVYIEGVKDKATKKYTAGKIYLIPKYIGKRDRHLYPFLQ